MMKNEKTAYFYFAVTRMIDDPHSYYQGRYSEAERYPDCINLASAFRNAVVVLPFKTMKEAEATAKDWNETARANGQLTTIKH